MKEIAMIQNTDDWLKMRNNYIGASEANIIMNQSKFKTPRELWEQKTGNPDLKDSAPPNFIQAKGHKMEEKMRNIMQMVYDTLLKPIVCVSDAYDFLMCSLDGYSETQGFVWENKYVGQNDFNTVYNGGMLEKYKPQVQHQLMVTGAPFCVFSVITEDKESTNEQFPFKYTHIEVQPDYQYMQNELLPALVKFWDQVKTKTPPDYVDNDRVNFDHDSEMVTLLGEYQERKLMVETISADLKETEKKIFAKIGKAKKAECCGVKITQSKSADKEVFDAKKFESENPIEDKYKKIQKGRITKRITFPKASS